MRARPAYQCGRCTGLAGAGADRRTDSGFKQGATWPNTIKYKIGEVFSEITNTRQSGYTLDELEHLQWRKLTAQHQLKKPPLQQALSGRLTAEAIDKQIAEVE